MDDRSIHVDRDLRNRFKAFCRARGVQMKALIAAMIHETLESTQVSVIHHISDAGTDKRRHHWENVKNLEVGESVFIGASEVAACGPHSPISQVGRRHGMRFSVEQGWRIRRIANVMPADGE